MENHMTFFWESRFLIHLILCIISFDHSMYITRNYLNWYCHNVLQSDDKSADKPGGKSADLGE